LRAAAARPAAARPPLPLFSDAAAAATGWDWPALAIERIGRFAAAAFDAGQARWAASAGAGLYAAWREDAMLDRTPEVLGLQGFRAAVAALPADAEAAIAAATVALDLPEATLAEVYHRALMSVGGWAGHARFRLWEAELEGREDPSLRDLLAVRLGWEAALAAVLAGRLGVAPAWAGARQRLAAPVEPSGDERIDAALQAAAEHAWRRALFARMAAGGAGTGPAAREAARPAMRPAVQAVFCIDVRSEVFRRALEGVSPEVETLGFAGFFGIALAVQPGAGPVRRQCPVLLAPGVPVEEAAPAQGPARAGLAAAWRRFRASAASAFPFVEAMGPAYLWRLVADGLVQREAPALAPAAYAMEGLGVASRAALAEGLLRGMSLTAGFAPLVLLAGHGSTSRNNPHASGLDCGACGGHTGEANAWVAATLLNDDAVRATLAARGIVIPDDTRFVAGLHDTTTDRMRLFDTGPLAARHGAALARLEDWLEAAGARARAERALRLDLAEGVPLDRAIAARSRDWSEVRPEWGLAGCAAFVAAPRERTRGLHLGGQAFLHTYDWRKDPEGAVLALILTAPVVVASWIALQYYGSVVDNAVLGAGNKVLHNVVGGIGVLEGNGGDLRPGLPLQSVADGAGPVHEPLRLTVLVEAPLAAMSAVVAAHADLRRLLENDWIALYAMGGDGAVTHRWRAGDAWESVAEGMAGALPGAA
jgi:uncharacterized protein YbcC (UPF0753/DUF2309 family)